MRLPSPHNGLETPDNEPRLQVGEKQRGSPLTPGDKQMREGRGSSHFPSPHTLSPLLLPSPSSSYFPFLFAAPQTGVRPETWWKTRLDGVGWDQVQTPQSHSLPLTQWEPRGQAPVPLNYGLLTTHVERLVGRGEGRQMGGPGTNSLRDVKLGGMELAGTRGGTWVGTFNCSPDQEWGWWGSGGGGWEWRRPFWHGPSCLLPCL